MKDNINKNKGISLISLVITIIVLLILAGVSIGSLNGENGILARAKDAKEKVAKEEVIENAKIDILKKQKNKRNTNITEDELRQILIQYGTITTGAANLYEETLITKENYQIPIKNIYEVVQSIPPGIDKNIYTDEDGNKAIIPEGFKVVPGCKKINKGLVISDDPNDTEEVGTEKIANGIQFVWVPVKEPKKMFGKDSEGNCGILYNFTQDSYSVKSTPRPTDSGYTEPDIVTLFDNKTENLSKLNLILGTNFDNGESFKISLQSDFNKMKSSVEKYGGFYIGRYESSLVGNDNNAYLVPKKGVKSATANETNNNTWYGLYARQKLYKRNNIEGSMIWGCQYDAMLIWLKENGIDVTKAIGEKRNKGKDQLGQEVGATGTVETDKLNNIYDLYGNTYEWTVEASKTQGRVFRGGRYKSDFSPTAGDGTSPGFTRSSVSTRATLYIP